MFNLRATFVKATESNLLWHTEALMYVRKCKKQLSTGARNACDDLFVVQPKIWKNAWVSVDNAYHGWCLLTWWDVTITS